MKLRFFVLPLTLALSTIAAYAQGGLYFNPIVTRVSISTPDSGTFAFLGQGNTSQIFGGVDFGGYYDIYKAPKFEVSADLREEIEHGNNAALDSFLAGLRVAAKPASSFKPYAQFSIGAGRTHSPINPVHATKFEYAIFGGVDRPLNKHIDWRVIEIGYGSVTTISSGLYTTLVTIPPARLLNFSTGIIFRLP